MQLHGVLQVVDFLRGAGQRPPDIHHVQHLQSAGLQADKVLVIAAQGRGAHVVAAYVKDDAVPVQHEGGRHLRRQGQSLDAGAGKVGGHQTDLLLLHQLAPLGQAEVGVHHIQVQKLRSVAPGSGPDGEIQRQLAFAAAVVADQHLDVFHGSDSP